MSTKGTKDSIALVWCDNGMVDGKFMQGVADVMLKSGVEFATTLRSQGNQIARQRQTVIDYDSRFYWGVDNPKQLEDITVTPEQGDPYTQHGLKHQWIAQVKDTANKLLAQSDWMVIRKVERSVDIPADTVTYRAAVIAECTRLVTAIQGCADVPALIAVVTAQGWPVNE